MAQKPPPLPSETLHRVLRVATFDGRFVMITAGTLAILHASAYQASGAILGCLIAGTGALELHGAGLLRAGEPRGLDWLVRSQLLLLATMLLYAATQLFLGFDSSQLANLELTSNQLRTLKQLNLTTEQFAGLVHTVSFVTVGFVSLIYQGALAFYYHRRRPAIICALTMDEDVAE